MLKIVPNRGAALALAVLAVWVGTSQALPRWPTINMEVFYEGLDPNSSKFFETQLLPTFSKINKQHRYMFVKLYPYGRSNTTKSNATTCDHGEKECQMNVAMVCANDLLKYWTRPQIEFSNCVIKNGIQVLNKMDKCTKPQKQLDPKKLMKCRTTPKENAELMREMSEKTPKEIFRNPLPMLRIDSKYSPQNDTAMKKDLFKFVCGYLNCVPAECKCTPGSLGNGTGFGAKAGAEAGVGLGAGKGAGKGAGGGAGKGAGQGAGQGAEQGAGRSKDGLGKAGAEKPIKPSGKSGAPKRTTPSSKTTAAPKTIARTSAAPKTTAARKRTTKRKTTTTHKTTTKRKATAAPKPTAAPKTVARTPAAREIAEGAAEAAGTQSSSQLDVMQYFKTLVPNLFLIFDFQLFP